MGHDSVKGLIIIHLKDLEGIGLAHLPLDSSTAEFNVNLLVSVKFLLPEKGDANCYEKTPKNLPKNPTKQQEGHCFVDIHARWLFVKL